MFDEPINGLDPDGILWIRNLMKSLGVRRPHGVPVESPHERDGSDRGSPPRHRRGRIIADASTDEFINRNSAPSVRVRAVEQGELADALILRGALVECSSDGALVVTGLDAAAIGGVASANGITLVELAPQVSSLEEAFFDLTRDETEFHAGQLAGSTKGI